VGIVQKIRDFQAGAKVSEHGIFDIPGRHELELPAGTVKVYDARMVLGRDRGPGAEGT
jgi:hypothetical protein